MTHEEIVEEFVLLQEDLIKNPKDYNQESLQNNINWLRRSLTTYRAQVLEEEKERIFKALWDKDELHPGDIFLIVYPDRFAPPTN